MPRSDAPAAAAIAREAGDLLLELRTGFGAHLSPAERGDRADWGVHVALWEHGELAMGAMAIPCEGTVLDSASVVAPRVRTHSQIRLAVSRSRPPAIAEPVREALDAELLLIGSAGYKIALAAQGRIDAYVHAGGLWEWDSAAPVAIARAAGLFTSRIDGTPLEYNSEDTFLPDLVVCRPELADTVLDAVASHEPVGAGR